jgi:flagellar protein FliS
MLYDGAIAVLHRAIAAIEAHDIEAKCKHLSRALAIIVQLEGTLDFERGGEVAQTLKSFYAWARAQVMKANIENSAEILRSLIENFTTVRDAWREGEHRLATQGMSSPAEDRNAMKEWGDARPEELTPSNWTV